MGRARGWLIALAVLAAAIPLASIPLTRPSASGTARIRLRVEGGAEPDVFRVDADGEQLLARFPIMREVRSRLPQLVGATLPIRAHLRETLGAQTFETGKSRDVVLEISADSDAAWGDVLWIIRMGRDPDIRIAAFELRITGTDRRLAWRDSLAFNVATTPIRDVVEIRIHASASGLYAIDQFQDRIEPFMFGGVEDDRFDFRPLRRVVNGRAAGDFDRPGWGEDAFLAAIRTDAAEEVADGRLRVGFTDPRAFSSRLGRVRFGVAFTVLTTILQLDPSAVFLGGGPGR